MTAPTPGHYKAVLVEVDGGEPLQIGKERIFVSIQLAQDHSAALLPREGLPLESILLTEELKRHPSRPPDYEREIRSLTALVQALANSPGSILQTLADTILEVFQVGP